MFEVGNEEVENEKYYGKEFCFFFFKRYWNEKGEVYKLIV